MRPPYRPARATMFVAIAILLVYGLELSWLLATSLAAAPGTARAPAQPELRLISSDSEHILVELETPPEAVTVEPDARNHCQRVSIADYGRTSRTGEPQLPVKGVLLGVPPGSDVSVRVVESEAMPVKIGSGLCPVPTVIVDTAEDIPAYAGDRFVRDARAYAVDGPYPVQLADVSLAGYVRDQQIGLLTVYPVQYNPVREQLWLQRRVRVEVRFANKGGFAPATVEPAPEAPSFETLLRDSLVNYEQARQWRKPHAAPKTQAAAAQVSTPAAWKVPVPADGIYRLSYADLQAAGLDLLGADPRNVRLYNHGHEVALDVAGEGDGRFDPSDSVEFYGVAAATIYTHTNVYWLTIGSTPGLRIGRREGPVTGTAQAAVYFSSTVHVEEDHLYSPAPTPSSGRDYWYWTRVRASDSPATATVTITAPWGVSEVYTSSLRVAVKSRGDVDGVNPDHHLKVFFDDLSGRPVLLENALWNGEVARVFSEQIPPGELHAITDTLRLEVPGDLRDLNNQPIADQSYLDWIELDYRRRYVAEGDRLFFLSPAAGRWHYTIEGFSGSEADAYAVYDISDPFNPTQIVSATMAVTGTTHSLEFEDTLATPGRYFVLSKAQKIAPKPVRPDTPSNLRANGNGADYLVISYADFVTATLPLVEYRRGQGLRTMVVDVEDIYDEFSDGVFDPEAIHRFLAYAYASWEPPAPSFVVLVGDGNLDFRDNFGTGERNYIPPYLAQVDPWMGETSTDNRYVTVSGDDTLPDMHVGRLPAATAVEVTAMVDKILRYEQGSPRGNWRRQTLFVADNKDDGGDFAAASDELRLHSLAPGYAADTVYHGITHTTVEATRQAIIQALNRGQLWVTYTGHAAVQSWAGEQLLRIEDLNLITNTTTLPFMVAWSCYEGIFSYPGFPSLDESMVRLPGKGPIATWSPAGLDVGVAHDGLATRLFDAVFRVGMSQIGPATTQAKIRLYQDQAGFYELLDTYLLFGDPALRLAMPSLPCYDFLSPFGVGAEDIRTVAGSWRRPDSYDTRYDVAPSTSDGVIDIRDIMTLTARWGEQCP